MKIWPTPFHVLLASAVLLLSACGGGSGGGSSSSPPSVATITLSPSTTTVDVGATQQLTATAQDSGGTTISDATFTYTSSDTGIATVSSSGLVTAVATGSATITATSGGVDGTAAITVAAAPIITVTGAAYAPGGALADAMQKSLPERMLAAIVPYANAQTAGLSPVSGAHLLVFRINADGTPNGPVLASAVTKADGTFSVPLPAGTTLASDLMLQVSPVTTARAVGPSGQNTENCPVTEADLQEITPAVEFATRTLIDQIRINGSSLSDYTIDEVTAIIKQAKTLATDASMVGANLEDTISNIALVEGPVMRRLIDDVKSAGAATMPPGIAGTYNLVGIRLDAGSDTVQLAQEIGTASIDTTAATYSVNLSADNVQLSVTCQASQTDRCARSFTRSASNSSSSLSGAFTVLSGNQIAFQPANNDGGAIGAYSSNGDMVVIPTETELIIGFKQSGSLPSLGGSFQAGEMNSALIDNVTVSASSPTWHTETTGTGSDTLTISGSTFTATSDQNTMEKDITCGTTCPDTEALSQASASTSYNGAISVDSSGILTVTPAGQTDLKGALLPGGTMFALNTGDVGKGGVGLAVGVKPGSGMSTSSLDGTYRLGSIMLNLGAHTTSVTIEGGTIILDGIGNGSGTLNGFESSITSNCNPSSCSDYTRSRKGITDAPTFTYTVSATGAVTFNTGGGSTVAGFASPDGRLVVLMRRMDGTIGSQTGNDSSHRGLLVLIR